MVEGPSQSLDAVSNPYADFIAAEHVAELQRKSAADAKAASLVTTSGGLVAILAAIGAFVAGSGEARVPWLASISLVLALVAFAAAAASGIMAGRPMEYEVGGVDAMALMVFDRWRDEENFARREVADVRVRMINNLRKVNDHKGDWLLVGWLCQVFALVVLSVVVVAVLA
jgi:hypothetical protein